VARNVGQSFTRRKNFKGADLWVRFLQREASVI